MIGESIAEPGAGDQAAQERFLGQLQVWQRANAGAPVVRSTAEWRQATGLDEATLTRVRQALRRQGVLRVDVCTAWAFSTEERSNANAVE